MMAPSERLAILGLLVTLKPKYTLEMGCADGGMTFWLSQNSGEVITVDRDPKVLEVAQALHNVTPLCMTTQEAGDLIETQGRHFNLTIIDADHSKEGVRRDLENAMRFSEIIVLHDTYFPPCREGILAALVDKNVYFDLELVPGRMQRDGLWGGLGIVIPNSRQAAKLSVTPGLSPYSLLYPLWLIRQSAQLVKDFSRRFRNRSRRLVARSIVLFRRRNRD